MNQSTNVKKQQSCAYLGFEGSYSHAALSSLLPGCEAIGQPDFDDVVRAVETRECDLAVMPVENSISGRIPEPHRLLNRLDLAICYEQIIPIKHCLTGGGDLSTAKARRGEGISIRSHRQGFLQCSAFLDEHFPHATLIAESDTASAVRMVAKAPSPDEFAIGSEYAAMLYGAKIVTRHINNTSDNYTRFVFLTHHDNWTPTGEENLTFMSFKVGNQPNALSKALGVLGDYEINLVRLEMDTAASVGGAPGFLIDAGVGVTDPVFMRAISEFEKLVHSIKILGSCVASQERSSISGFLPIKA